MCPSSYINAQLFEYNWIAIGKSAIVNSIPSNMPHCININKKKINYFIFEKLVKLLIENVVIIVFGDKSNNYDLYTIQVRINSNIVIDSY